MKIEWKRLNSLDELPRDGSRFLALYKGLISIAQYDEEEKVFYVSFAPAEYSDFQARIHKFEYWCELDYPAAYPEDWANNKFYPVECATECDDEAGV